MLPIPYSQPFGGNLITIHMLSIDNLNFDRSVITPPKGMKNTNHVRQISEELRLEVNPRREEQNLKSEGFR